MSDEVAPSRLWHHQGRVLGAGSKVARSSFSWRRALLFLVLMVFAIDAAAWSVRIYSRKYYIFAPSYVRWALTPTTAVAAGHPTHIFFLFVDHFEPLYDLNHVKSWERTYRELASRHRDADGRPPQHTWFYPGEQHSSVILRELREMTASGLGEVELHYHHDSDTAETLRPKLQTAIAEFRAVGFLETTSGDTRFAFIHGNSGLDNSDGPINCGVSNEISLLHDLGNYADFTFPSIWDSAQPPSVNNIYAARDDERPKSYAQQLPLSSLQNGRADVMIFQGPLVFALSPSWRRLFVDVDDGDIHPPAPASPERFDRWLRANVHVPQRPDWVFIKVFAHGISTPGDEAAAIGPTFDQTLSYMEQKYNDGRRYVLHYITAREAYNLARAAADGEAGDPAQYLDWVVPPYKADAREVIARSTGAVVRSD